MLQKSKIVLAKGVRVIGSFIHITFQSAADLTLESEVKILEVIDIYELTSKELKQARTERTRLMQYKLKKAFKSPLRIKDLATNQINNVEL